jgi:hypothetical protein
MVLPPQRRWAATGVYTPRCPRSRGEVEVGAATRSLDPPEVAAGGAVEAPGHGLTAAGVVAAFH